MSQRIVLSGATGFVGGHLYPRLAEQAHTVLCGTRHPAAACERAPERHWIALDFHRDDTVRKAFEGADVVYYLVHAMAEGPGYHARELDAARGVLEAAAAAGVERLIYLGGVEPAGRPSAHLQSRLDTGQLLREGSVPCIELRAGMIIGPGSASFSICRDLAARLPFMLLPKWLDTRSQPVAIEDVVAALSFAATMPCTRSVVYDLPGPEILAAKDILLRIARLRGTEPVTIKVPVLTPRLSSYWLKLVSGADFSIAKELVEGLRNDLVASGTPIWNFMPGHVLRTFDEAAADALQRGGTGGLLSRGLEAATRLLSRRGAS